MRSERPESPEERAERLDRIFGEIRARSETELAARWVTAHERRRAVIRRRRITVYREAYILAFIVVVALSMTDWWLGEVHAYHVATLLLCMAGCLGVAYLSDWRQRLEELQQ